MGKCVECNKHIGMFSKQYECTSCKKTPLCGHCVYYSVEGDSTEPKPYCFEDFKKVCNIDFKTQYDDFGPKEAPVAILVHGGGASRKYWYELIPILSKKFRCIALDLPGHGANVKDPINLELAIEHVVKITKEVSNGKPALYVGYSLGGYLGFEIVGRHPDLYSAAIICAAGQNVGHGASMYARFGLWAMDNMAGLAKGTIINLMLNEARKNGHINNETLRESILRPSMYFEWGHEQVQILRTVKPETIKAFGDKPILYVTGQKDHHDSNDKWKSFNKNAESLEIPGADHFFMGDDRYKGVFFKAFEDFTDKLLAQQH